MSKKFDAAAIAAKYKQRRVQCYVCLLPPDEKELVRALRLDQGLSFNSISKALDAELNVRIGSAAVQHHFKEHERDAA